MPIALAIVGAAAIGGGASLIASSNASNTAKDVAAQDNALQSQIYQSNKGMIEPFVDRGNAAGDELSGFLGLGGDPAKTKAAFGAYLNSTGYQFNYDQGIDAVTSSKAAAGLLNSGATLKALDTFGTALADTYGQQYADNLFKVDQLGGQSASALAGVGQNYANAVGANNNNAAAVSANAGLASANAFAGILGQGLSAYGLTRGTSSFGGGGGNAFGANPGILT